MIKNVIAQLNMVILLTLLLEVMLWWCISRRIERAKFVI